MRKSCRALVALLALGSCVVAPSAFPPDALAQAPAAPVTEVREAVTPLTLGDAIERALAHHPTPAAAREATNEARAAVGEARAGWFPALKLSGSATQYEKPMAAAPMHGFRLDALPPFDETLFVSSLSLGYTLFDGGSREARVRQARARETAAQASLAGAEASIITRVAATYLDALAKAQTLDAHDRRLESLRAERVRVGQRYDVGRAAPLETLRIDATLASAEADRVHLGFALETAEQDLARLIDAPVEQTRAAQLKDVAAADTTLAPRAALLAEALAASPAVRQARGARAAAQAGRSLARGARWPDFKLAASYVDYADADGHETAEWNAGLQATLALFTGGAVSGAIARADAAARGADDQVRLAELQAGQDLDRALSSVAEARARVRSLERAVASFAEVARIEQLALAAGSSTQNDYLRAEAELLAARANLIEARYREIVARVELARVTGTLDMGWVQRNLEAES
jgi:outer membrane protein